VVFVGMVAALAVAVFSVAWFDNLSGAGWLALGIVPFAWVLLRAVERLIGREIWHYTAPYPSQSTHIDEAMRPDARPRAAHHRETDDEVAA
jgi:hypothetical protein